MCASCSTTPRFSSVDSSGRFSPARTDIAQFAACPILPPRELLMRSLVVHGRPWFCLCCAYARPTPKVADLPRSPAPNGSGTSLIERQLAPAGGPTASHRPTALPPRCLPFFSCSPISCSRLSRSTRSTLRAAIVNLRQAIFAWRIGRPPPRAPHAAREGRREQASRRAEGKTRCAGMSNAQAPMTNRKEAESGVGYSTSNRRAGILDCWRRKAEN